MYKLIQVQNTRDIHIMDRLQCIGNTQDCFHCISKEILGAEHEVTTAEEQATWKN